MTPKHRTFLVVAVLFVAGGLQFIHPYLSEPIYAGLNSLILGIEALLQINATPNPLISTDSNATPTV